MAKIHGGRLVARALKAEGVDTLFTLTGGHIVPILDGCVEEGIRIVDVRHEETAGHAAEAYSRLTGRLGVAAVTAGPGVTNTVTAVMNAYHSHTPICQVDTQSREVSPMNDEQRTTTHDTTTITAFGKDVADATLGESQKRQQATADRLREANGGSDDITRGPHSSGRDDSDPRSAEQLREDLLRMGGASDADIRWDKINRGL